MTRPARMPSAPEHEPVDPGATAPVPAPQDMPLLPHQGPDDSAFLVEWQMEAPEAYV